MAEYTLYVEMVDSMGRKASKRYRSAATVADWAAAQAAALGLVQDLMAISELRVLAYTLALRTINADDFDTGANRDEGATLIVEKTDNYRAALKVPGPIQEIRNIDGTVDVTSFSVAAYIANFIDGSDLWSLSDGEFITGVVSGKMDI